MFHLAPHAAMRWDSWASTGIHLRLKLQRSVWPPTKIAWAQELVKAESLRNPLGISCYWDVLGTWWYMCWHQNSLITISCDFKWISYGWACELPHLSQSVGCWGSLKRKNGVAVLLRALWWSKTEPRQTEEEFGASFIKRTNMVILSYNIPFMIWSDMMKMPGWRVHGSFNRNTPSHWSLAMDLNSIRIHQLISMDFNRFHDISCGFKELNANEQFQKHRRTLAQGMRGPFARGPLRLGSHGDHASCGVHSLLWTHRCARGCHGMGFSLHRGLWVLGLILPT